MLRTPACTPSVAGTILPQRVVGDGKDRTVGLPEDRELLAAFRAGDRNALERVYRAHARSLERYLLALARSRGGQMTPASLVTDLVQEVFIRAFSQEARLAYDGYHDYSHYLAVVARNCFIDALRARGREVLLAPEDIPADLASAPEPADWCDPLSLSVLETYVRSLPVQLLATYQHRFIEELSQEETAAALGITRRAVRTAERRLRAGLRKALIKAGVPLAPLVRRRVEANPGFLAMGAKRGES
jgi:RNA polymerase sigma factor (sigma-70 family)